MITDILTYIDSYENIRAACGLNHKELPDATLALSLYLHKLGLALEGISGIYTPETEKQNLQEIFARPVPTTDPMYAQIQLYSIYTVADVAMTSVGLSAFKLQTDGKSTLGRFSPESTYKGTRQAIKDMLDQVRQEINDLLGISSGDLDILRVVPPDINVVTGE